MGHTSDEDTLTPAIGRSSPVFYLIFSLTTHVRPAAIMPVCRLEGTVDGTYQTLDHILPVMHFQCWLFLDHKAEFRLWCWAGGRLTRLTASFGHEDVLCNCRQRVLFPFTSSEPCIPLPLPFFKNYWGHPCTWVGFIFSGKARYSLKAPRFHELPKGEKGHPLMLEQTSTVTSLCSSFLLCIPHQYAFCQEADANTSPFCQH